MCMKLFSKICYKSVAKVMHLNWLLNCFLYCFSTQELTRRSGKNLKNKCFH